MPAMALLRRTSSCRCSSVFATAASSSFPLTARWNRGLGGRGFIFEVFGFFNEETARDFLSALHAADPFACRT
jgi:hypothetical protein